jgi:DNA polymerase/3'-5' exonuclease PolX
MHATGPAILNVTMRRWGYANGLALSWEGVHRLDNGEFIAGETELECAEAVGWPLAEPALRELCLDWMGPFLDELNGAEGQDAP